jgi:hypothetical protein
MTVGRSAGDVLSDHTVFEIECIDRMYLNVWVRRLAYGAGVQGFCVAHRGHHYASTALMDPMTKAFVADIHGFIAARGLELVSFGKQRKDARETKNWPQDVYNRDGPGASPVGRDKQTGPLRGCR